MYKIWHIVSTVLVIRSKETDFASRIVGFCAYHGRSWILIQLVLVQSLASSNPNLLPSFVLANFSASSTCLLSSAVRPPFTLPPITRASIDFSPSVEEPKFRKWLVRGTILKLRGDICSWSSIGEFWSLIDIWWFRRWCYNIARDITVASAGGEN